MSDDFDLFRDFSFSAAHRLPLVGEGHPCGRVHGHTYSITVHLSGPVKPDFGWVVDFGFIDEVVKPVVDELDHQMLNDIGGLDNPTSEQVALWLAAKLSDSLPELVAITVREGGSSGCTWRRSRP